LIGYCCGNIELLKLADFSEICEIIDYLVTKTNDETLLRAYQVSYAALQNINFEEFKTRVMKKTAGLQSTAQPSIEEIHQKVKHYANDFRWKEV
jgi:hypothetical protein